MSQYQYATTELRSLLQDYFGQFWTVVVSQRPKNAIFIEGSDGKRIEAKHVVRALELLPDIFVEMDPFEVAALNEEKEELEKVLDEKNDEIKRLERDVDEANDATLKLEEENQQLQWEIDDLKEELRQARLKIHTSNVDED